MGVRNQQNTKIPTQKMYFGTAIYNGAATSTVTFSDIPSGYTYVIATCQDAGTAILVASLSGTSLKVIFSNQITIARVNFFITYCIIIWGKRYSYIVLLY